MINDSQRLKKYLQQLENANSLRVLEVIKEDAAEDRGITILSFQLISATCERKALNKKWIKGKI